MLAGGDVSVDSAITRSQESVEEFRRRKRVAWQMKMRRRGWWATAVHWATFQFMLSPSLSELWLALGFEAPAGHRVQYTGGERRNV